LWRDEFDEFRDREKVMRGIKKEDSMIFDGSQICHNYVRPHMALDGKTPAEVCGIEIKGHDKWKTIIQNSIIPKSIWSPKRKNSGCDYFSCPTKS